MRRLTAEQMKDMPIGTLFLYGGDEGKDELVLAESGISFFYGRMSKIDCGSWDWNDADLPRIDCEDSIDMIDKFYDMKENGSAYPIEQEPGGGRYGLYPRNPIFFVLEPADLLIIRSTIDLALSVAIKEGGAP